MRRGGIGFRQRVVSFEGGDKKFSRWCCNAAVVTLVGVVEVMSNYFLLSGEMRGNSKTCDLFWDLTGNISKIV